MGEDCGEYWGEGEGRRGQGSGEVQRGFGQEEQREFMIIKRDHMFKYIQTEFLSYQFSISL